MRIKIIQEIIDKIRGKNKKLLHIKDYGKNNHFYIIKENGEKYSPKSVKGLNIEFYGNNSIITIHEPFNFNNVSLKCTSNNTIDIGKNSLIAEGLNLKCPMREGAKLIIGEDFTCVSANIYLHDEPNIIVKIGNDCMFSFDIIIWPSDGHTILDSNKKPINKGENIIIGDHVWLGMGSKILKGSVIPNNSMIGAGSIFLKSSNVGSDCVCGGGGICRLPC